MPVLRQDSRHIIPIECKPKCPSQCENVFDRVVVSYLVAGGSKVFWELKQSFQDPGPYTFTLQVGQSANPDADDWEDVGAPVVDMFFATDGVQRTYGKLRFQFYRVKLVTAKDTYYSDPTGLMGTLSPTDWRLARATLRSEIVYMRAGDGTVGYLLKKRISGTPCPNCLDPQTMEVTQPNCPYCFGTSFLCGYFYPSGCVWADISPKTYHMNQDMSRGTVTDISVRARMLNTWVLNEGDVYVDKLTDDRYYIHSVQNLYEFRGVPLVAMVEMRPAPGTDPIYQIQIPDQIERLDRFITR